MRTIYLNLLVGLSSLLATTMADDDLKHLKEDCNLDHNDDDFNAQEFYCLFMQFDHNYDQQVTEAEFEAGWTHMKLGYEERIPLFFLEIDVTGDYVIKNDDMAYLKAIMDVDGDGIVSDKELEAGWLAFFVDRFKH